MDISTISTKFQVVIPKKIRQQYNLQPGQKLLFIPYNNSLRIIVVPPIQEGFGFIPGIDTTIQRDEEDRV